MGSVADVRHCVSLQKNVEDKWCEQVACDSVYVDAGICGWKKISSSSSIYSSTSSLLQETSTTTTITTTTTNLSTE
eukprot:Awhi_evm1s12274